MARAAAYDEWEDAGLALSDDEVNSYQPVQVGQKRVAQLSMAVRLLLRQVETGQPKTATIQDAANRLLDAATWYCRALGLEGINREELTTLPKASTAEGKKLTAQSLKLPAPDLLRSLREKAEADMRYAVTIGRRCEGPRRAAGGWSKENRSASNRLANSINKEMNAIRKALDAWASTTKGEDE